MESAFLFSKQRTTIMYELVQNETNHSVYPV